MPRSRERPWGVPDWRDRVRQSGRVTGETRAPHVRPYRPADRADVYGLIGLPVGV